jgi:predicted ATPase with chaperone activity
MGELCACCKFDARERLLHAKESFSNVFLKNAHSLLMSQDSYPRVFKPARMMTDLAGSEESQSVHLVEILQN